MSTRGRDRGRSRKSRGARPRSRTTEPERFVEIRIDSLAAGGDGVGRDSENRVVFVPFTAPGDRVRVRVVEAHARFLVGLVDALLEPSPVRTDPVCAVFGTCGGCSWQHIEYEAQIAAKADIVRDAFTRIGKLTLPSAVEVAPSPETYGYRSRARVLADGTKVGFRRRRSHVVCATDRCPILVPELRSELAALAKDPPRRAGEWELACGGGAPRAVALPAPGGRPIRFRVNDVDYAVSPGVFVQSNAMMLERLDHAVTAAAGTGILALDLFAGAGFLTVGLARSFDHVIAVESHATAVRDLRSNLSSAGCGSVEVIESRVEDALLGARIAPQRPDAVILDPPRTGLPPDTADAIADLAPQRIVYLACDPATQARDARVFCARGYELVSLEGFDLFPQTPHVETLAVFEASDQGSTSPWRTA